MQHSLQLCIKTGWVKVRFLLFMSLIEHETRRPYRTRESVERWQTATTTRHKRDLYGGDRASSQTILNDHQQSLGECRTRNGCACNRLAPSLLTAS